MTAFGSNTRGDRVLARPAGAYATRVAQRMASSENAWGRPVSIRELSIALHRSYEHCRKIVRGEPVVSYDLNARLCAALHLDAVEMWATAVGEKLRRRYVRAFGSADPVSLFREVWPLLSAEDRERVIALAISLATERHAQPDSAN